MNDVHPRLKFKALYPLLTLGFLGSSDHEPFVRVQGISKV